MGLFFFSLMHSLSSIERRVWPKKPVVRWAGFDTWLWDLGKRRRVSWCHLKNENTNHVAVLGDGLILNMGIWTVPDTRQGLWEPCSSLRQNGSQAENACGKFLWPMILKVARGIETDHFLGYSNSTQEWSWLMIRPYKIFHVMCLFPTRQQKVIKNYGEPIRWGGRHAFLGTRSKP